jgi:hypothetical protein
LFFTVSLAVRSGQSEAKGVVTAPFSMVHLLIFARSNASAFLVSIAARFAV